MPKVLEIRELTLPEAKELLERRMAEGGAERLLRVTYEYVSKFSKLPAKLAVELRKELVEKFGLSTFAAVQVVNIMPETVDELRTILAKERTFTTEELQKIVDLLNEYRRRAESEQAESGEQS